jgi:hypothetical protein
MRFSDSRDCDATCRNGAVSSSRMLSDRTRNILSLAVMAGFTFMLAGTAKSKEDTPSPTSSATPASTSPTTKAAPAKDPEPAWVATVRANCERYKAAPNEIKKSAVFNENETLLKSSGVEKVRGTLKRLSTTQGGEQLSLVVTMGDLEFATEALFGPIKKGSPVYNAAADLTVGQCVIFSAKGLRASSVVEESKVCDTEYYANFTAIGPCP